MSSWPEAKWSATVVAAIGVAGAAKAPRQSDPGAATGPGVAVRAATAAAAAASESAGVQRQLLIGLQSAVEIQFVQPGLETNVIENDSQMLLGPDTDQAEQMTIKYGEMLPDWLDMCSTNTPKALRLLRATLASEHTSLHVAEVGGPLIRFWLVRPLELLATTTAEQFERRSAASALAMICQLVDVLVRCQPRLLLLLALLVCAAQPGRS
eukprot:SAG22_NODE_834_length_6927_cov_7.202402_2_plen_210_part_00